MSEEWRDVSEKSTCGPPWPRGHGRTGPLLSRSTIAFAVLSTHASSRAIRCGVLLLRSSWQASACVVRAERRGLCFDRAGTGGVSRALVTSVPAVDQPACRGGSQRRSRHSGVAGFRLSEAESWSISDRRSSGLGSPAGAIGRRSRGGGRSRQLSAISSHPEGSMRDTHGGNVSTYGPAFGSRSLGGDEQRGASRIVCPTSCGVVLL